MNPQDKIAIRRVVLAGMQVMYDKTTFQIFKAGMMKKEPLPDKLATQAAGLMKSLQDKANGRIPRPILVPAAMMLVLEIAKFMEEVGLVKPTQDDIKAAYVKLIQVMKAAFPNVKPRMTPGATQAPGTTVPPQAPGGTPPAQPAPPAAPPGLIQSAPMGA